MVVVGSTGSGKTTLARQLAAWSGVPHVELDALHWDPGWTEAPLEVFRARVTAALAGPAWVVDGNYSAVRDLVWPRADTIIWLDYGLPHILGRLVRRTVHRVVSQEELWNGNRESLRGAFFSRDSLFIWALQTYGRRRREYPVLLSAAEHAHLRVLHFHTPRATRAWLAGLPPRAMSGYNEAGTAGVRSRKGGVPMGDKDPKNIEKLKEHAEEKKEEATEYRHETPAEKEADHAREAAADAAEPEPAEA
ncbi:MAG TPA: adenylate kinase [Chloroflexia bacterium]|nr:adenylate kinase [Chloroflexia bacterium]